MSICMKNFPIFLSIVFVVRNGEDSIYSTLYNATHYISKLVEDYELIIVDNASQDDGVEILKQLTDEDGLPNLQIYALTKEVDLGTASWVGIENALGDFVAVIDFFSEDIGFLETMLGYSVNGTDVVFAENLRKSKQTITYRICFFVFNFIYKCFNDINLSKEAPQYRLLSKRVINFILQHPIPALAYKYLPATAGFSRENLTYYANISR